MRRLDFTLEPDTDDSPAIGLVVLQSDETLEHELKQWLPRHYRLFHTRIPNEQSIGEASLQAMHDEIPSSVSLLPSHTALKVIVYGCTSASTVIGEAEVESAVQSVFPESRVTNPLTAIKAQLRYLSASRIAVLTPYVPEVSAALIHNLQGSGYEIVNSGSFHEALDHRVARISKQSLLAAISTMAEDRSVDAIVASCTNLRTYDIIEQASAQYGCAVISSNSALAWHVQSLLRD